MHTNTLPILLKNPRILLIGGGKVALQKARVLTENSIDFEALSMDFIEAFDVLGSCKVVKSFDVSDIGDFRIVIDATGNSEVAQMLIDYKKTHPLLLNVVDVPALCDFYFMALSKNRPLQIAVTSNGASPTAAKYFRDLCEALIPQDISAWLETQQKERIKGLINPDQARHELKKMTAKVYLVGCGVGDVELLTLKAYRIIQSVDVVLYDHLISKEIMALVPATTQKIYVGKQKSAHSMSQDTINGLLVDYAARGLKIARLKSGDPFVFGRGAEELQTLVMEGIQAEVIPGISSALAAPLLADIPITARGLSSGFSIVSAHLKNSALNLDWVPLLGLKNHTVVVLMGLSRAQEIVSHALSLGMNSSLPCAVISNASRDNQTVLTTTLKALPAAASTMPSPAVLVFGEVVGFKAHIEKLAHSIHIAA